MKKQLIVCIGIMLVSACTEAPQNEQNKNMEVRFTHLEQEYAADLTHPLDLSVPIDTSGPLAWYLDHPNIEAVRDENWVGVVAEGGSVNFRNIHFNPHGHGTHTEGPGHVESTVHSINQSFNRFHFTAAVITVSPRKLENGDEVIYWEMMAEQVEALRPQAVVIRSSTEDNRNRNWSNSNPPYLDAYAAERLAGLDVEHLLIDLPSVDRESDEGKLAAHKAFWRLNGEKRMNATITELIHVPAEVADGLYLLNLQVGAFENDASPSRPVLYQAIIITK